MQKKWKWKTKIPIIRKSFLFCNKKVLFYDKISLKRKKSWIEKNIIITLRYDFETWKCKP